MNKFDVSKTEKTGDELIQQMLYDILYGLKTKLVQPLWDKNLKIAERLEELKEQDQAGIAELKERLAVLEDKVQQMPLTILAAMRDAISQAGGRD
jgi:hypothetical protein